MATKTAILDRSRAVSPHQHWSTAARVRGGDGRRGGCLHRRTPAVSHHLHDQLPWVPMCGQPDVPRSRFPV